jgi:hypothetical protein
MLPMQLRSLTHRIVNREDIARVVKDDVLFHGRQLSSFERAEPLLIGKQELKEIIEKIDDKSLGKLTNHTSVDELKQFH